MWLARSRFASSMKGFLSASVNDVHIVPSRLLISELCIFGFSCAIRLRWPRDHTMKAFMGRLTLSSFFPAPLFDAVLAVDDGARLALQKVPPVEYPGSFSASGFASECC